MTTLQIAFAVAYKKCAEMLKVVGDESVDSGQITEEMVLIRYWYAGEDPEADPDRRNTPPPPPPPPWWY